MHNTHVRSQFNECTYVQSCVLLMRTCTYIYRPRGSSCLCSSATTQLTGLEFAGFGFFQRTTDSQRVCVGHWLQHCLSAPRVGGRPSASVWPCKCHRGLNTYVHVRTCTCMCTACTYVWPHIHKSCCQVLQCYVCKSLPMR